MSWAFYLFALLRRPQFNFHKALLLLKLPESFYEVVKKKEDDLVAEICKDCNQLRFFKRDAISLALINFLQLIVIGINQIPYVGWIVSMPFHVVWTGRAIAEYPYASRGVCGKHRKTTFQNNSELFFVLGSIHFLLTLAARPIIELSLKLLTTVYQVFLGKHLVEYGESFPPFSVINQIITGVFNTILDLSLRIPTIAYQSFFGGVLMLFMVGLTYFMKLPKPVAKTKRYFPMLGADFIVENTIEIFINHVKSKLKNKEDALEFLVEIKEKLSLAKNLRGKVKGVYEVQSIRSPYFKMLLPLFVPSVIQSADNFFKDPILLQHWPDVANNGIETIKTLLKYRALILKVQSLTPRLLEFRTDSKVKTFLRWFGGPVNTVNKLFTLEFVVIELPLLLGELRELVSWMRTKHVNLITEAHQLELCEVIDDLAKNINLLKKILGEFPDDTAKEIIALIADKDISKSLKSVKRDLFELLKKHKKLTCVETVGDAEDAAEIEMDESEAEVIEQLAVEEKAKMRERQEGFLLMNDNKPYEGFVAPEDLKEQCGMWTPPSSPASCSFPAAAAASSSASGNGGNLNTAPSSQFVNPQWRDASPQSGSDDWDLSDRHLTQEEKERVESVSNSQKFFVAAQSAAKSGAKEKIASSHSLTE